ncbi:heme ABC transporter ATP-binding protein [Gilvimarinus sp. SDUM040013]|uniref:Heme ABC transporter ATP-binding protein n=1 Tax=Gilvimarinus gilvus TaxID=3058038 RepID=A0ABU4S105_9GAMM|nr:heme ABC transporter ATP-binding protein [Gilvimarinus sp. SDUM040013]MDO3384573.1 heme ABC transporter ATP-binding protein [Gilvimarinus sp. SDUM040013]MDX6850091.1 heme ABC transporter ATP-binding protein [Gilvimarinus sp. SDUM040013]
MTRLRIEQVAVHVAGKPLLLPMDLNVAAGEVVSVIGPNGAGKTTLLRAIAGDVNASGGRVLLEKQLLSTIEPRARARQMAVLSQHNTLEFAFTGFEVVAMSRGPHSTGRVLDVQICHEAMEAMDVSHLAKRFYPTLSGGEQQRLHLARVLAQIWREQDARERLLLLDEPVTSLDIGHQHQLMEAVKSFAATGVAVLMTVHDITLAASYSDRLVVLDRGRCVANGQPQNVLTEALVSDVFETDVLILPHPKTGKPIVVGNASCN